MRALSRVIGFDLNSGQPVEAKAGGTLQIVPPGNVASGVIAPGQITSGMIKTGLDNVLTVEPRVHLDEAVKILIKVWHGLCRSGSKEDRMWVVGHIEAFRDLGVLNETEYKGWLLQIATCPGHDGTFNPADCMYCAPNV